LTGCFSVGDTRVHLADGGDHGVDPVIGEYALEKGLQVLAVARGIVATRIAPGTIFETITS